MNEAAATRLAGEIADTFLLGPKVHIWRDALDRPDLDIDAAWTTYRRLRDNRDDRALTIAHFRDEYHRTVGETDDGPNDCHRCDDGWTPGPPIAYPTATNPDHATTSVKPCQCPAGQARARSSVWRLRNEQ